MQTQNGRMKTEYLRLQQETSGLKSQTAALNSRVTQLVTENEKLKGALMKSQQMMAKQRQAELESKKRMEQDGLLRQQRNNEMAQKIRQSQRYFSCSCVALVE